MWLQRRVLATALTTPQVPPPSSDLGRSRTGNFFEARLGGAEPRHVCNGLQDAMLSKVLCAKHQCQRGNRFHSFCYCFLSVNSESVGLRGHRSPFSPTFRSVCAAGPNAEVAPTLDQQSCLWHREVLQLTVFYGPSQALRPWLDGAAWTAHLSDTGGQLVLGKAPESSQHPLVQRCCSQSEAVSQRECCSVFSVFGEVDALNQDKDNA